MTTLRVPLGTSAALPKGAHRALCEKWAILDPFSPIAKVTAATTVYRTAQILTQSKKLRK